MGTKDPRVDAYIDRAQEFAKPILTHLRDVVHAGCPQVAETMKWSSPHFEYKGLLCGIAAFTQHCVFGFWKGPLVVGKHVASDDAMGQFGRITSIRDLPPKKELIALVRKAAALNEEGVKLGRSPRPRTTGAVAVPDDLAGALRRNKQAREHFDAFSPSQRRDYVEWLEEAKRDETRTRRLETAIAQMAVGKTRNWKYEARQEREARGKSEKPEAGSGKPEARSREAKARSGKPEAGRDRDQ